MELGARLSSKGRLLTVPLTATNSTSSSRLDGCSRQRVVTWTLLGFVALGLIVLFFETHFYDSGPCHSRVVALRRHAFSKGTERLSLSNCVLAKLPEGLLELKALRFLDLSGNKIDERELDQLKQLSNLEILFLSSNGLTIVPSSIRHLARLRMLALRDNGISRVASIEFPSSLEWLILTENKISSIEGGLPSTLRKLMLSNNQLTEFPENLASMTKLELLRVSNNRIPAARLSFPVKVVPSLRWYACSDNPAPWKAPEAEAFRIDSAKVTKQKMLGQGSSGVVWQARFQNSLVAFKEFKRERSSDGLVMNEINMASIVSTSNVPFLQRLVGWSSSPLLAVAYEMPSEEKDYRGLANPPSFHSCTRDTYEPGTEFKKSVALGALMDVARALMVLHEKGIAHGDIYGHNVRYNPNTEKAILLDLGSAWRFDQVDASIVQAMEMRAFAVLVEELLERASYSSYSPAADFAKKFVANPPPTAKVALERLLAFAKS